MQTWKRKKNVYQSKQKARKKWPMIVFSIFFLVLTIGLALVHFPAYWNQTIGQKINFTIPETSFRLGLDLQGGTHLVYEADMSQIPASERSVALDGVRDVIERRVNAFGVAEPLIQTTSSGDTHRLIVELAGVLDVNEAIKQIGETPILEFKEQNTDISEDVTDEDQAKLEEQNAIERENANNVLAQALAGENFDELMNQYNGEAFLATENSFVYGSYVKNILDQSLKVGQVSSSTIEDQNGIHILKYLESVDSKQMELSHLLICFEGKANCENPIPAIEASTQIQKIKEQATSENFADLVSQYSTDIGTKNSGGSLGKIDPGQTVVAFELEALRTPVGEISSVVETDFGYHLIYKSSEEPVTAYRIAQISLPLTQLEDFVSVDPSRMWKNTALSGKHLKRSSVQFNPNTGTPYVSLEFDSEGSELFAQITQRNVSKYVAIFLDGEPISIPVVNQAIYGGKAIIEGNFTLEEAKLLAQRLNAGALPVPIHLLSQQTIGPTLGKISLDKSIEAALIGLSLVGIFMIVFYRFSGIIAVFALILYVLLNISVYKFFGVTMTLAGIAGLVLSLGMAVDANVLIFERMKEELRSGRDLRSSMDEGFRRAWSAIRDGNITTLIAALVLYGFSSSFIKGFALTLSIGVLLSMFTAISVTRVYLITSQFIPFLRKKVFLYAPFLKSSEEKKV
ncbi:protein translocase subunit SecD [Candidatus Uhrbacteria bacterium CG_4_9_14_3_um_filter_36_7]|uniref:Protein translocase subunit SecD n=1 Tax=Candidatus Uhrbacteria bacterium CG_4_9_14_3_um_filter_36_7 TaxID=1975033 RepID=A0A2M7XGA8_9BACT|nr:MAG: protein translocase subunit SecD [Candidatus Uhrbacteria bacterium CG_4_9_14_3_um_filter_36_7]